MPIWHYLGLLPLSICLTTLTFFHYSLSGDNPNCRQGIGSMIGQLLFAAFCWLDRWSYKTAVRVRPEGVCLGAHSRKFSAVVDWLACGCVPSGDSFLVVLCSWHSWWHLKQIVNKIKSLIMKVVRRSVRCISGNGIEEENIHASRPQSLEWLVIRC